MIEWKNVDFIPHALTYEGKPYLLLDRSKKGPLFRLRLGYPDLDEHPTLRIKRANFKRIKNEVVCDKLNAASADLNVIAAILGFKPLSNVRKVKGELPMSLSLRHSEWWGPPVLTTGSYVIGAQGYSYATPPSFNIVANVNWQAAQGTWAFDLETQPLIPPPEGEASNDGLEGQANV